MTTEQPTKYDIVVDDRLIGRINKHMVERQHVDDETLAKIIQLHITKYVIFERAKEQLEILKSNPDLKESVLNTIITKVSSKN